MSFFTLTLVAALVVSGFGGTISSSSSITSMTTKACSSCKDRNSGSQMKEDIKLRLFLPIVVILISRN